MAFRKTLAKIYSQIRAPTSSPASSAVIRRRFLQNSGVEEGLLRRILQRRPIFQAAVPPDRWLPTGDRLVERIRGLNQDRIRLDVLAPPPMPPTPSSVWEAQELGEISVKDVKKVLRASQMEAVRATLREIPGSSIAYSEFVKICCDESGAESGIEMARALDESGSVIVFGNVVFLRPEQIVRAVESIIPIPTSHPNDPRKQELKELEQKKAEIDNKAEALVRRELWCGLGIIVAQTAGLMRLTFWELSWDVMEPICFFFTSCYFIVGYAFFLRTSKDPSFEGFFESRFAAKQKRLMRARGFDLRRFNELRGASDARRRYPSAPSWEELCSHRGSSYCDCRKRSTLVGVAH